MTGGSIENNTSTEGCGGVGLRGDHAVAEITGGNISGNTGRNGGGIRLEKGQLAAEESC